MMVINGHVFVFVADRSGPVHDPAPWRSALSQRAGTWTQQTQLTPRSGLTTLCFVTDLHVPAAASS